MVNGRAKGLTHGQVVVDMKGTLLMVTIWAKGLTLGKMAIDTKGTSSIISGRAKGLTPGQVAINTKEPLLRTNAQATELSFAAAANDLQAFSKRAGQSGLILDANKK